MDFSLLWQMRTGAGGRSLPTDVTNEKFNAVLIFSSC